MITRREEWNRWTGHRADLVDAINKAIGLIREAGDDHPDARVEIVLPRYSFESKSAEELRTLDARDLPAIKSLSARVEGRHTSLSIRADETAPAVTIEVRGERQTAVDGVATPVIGILDRGRPSVPAVSAEVALVIAVSWLIAGLTVGGIIRDRFGLDGLWFGASVSFVGTSAVAVVLLLATLFPNLEILPEGGQTRWRRFRARIGWAVGAVAAVIGIATAVWALAD